MSDEKRRTRDGGAGRRKARRVCAVLRRVYRVCWERREVNAEGISGERASVEVEVEKMCLRRAGWDCA